MTINITELLLTSPTPYQNLTLNVIGNTTDTTPTFQTITNIVATSCNLSSTVGEYACTSGDNLVWACTHSDALTIGQTYNITINCTDGSTIYNLTREVYIYNESIYPTISFGTGNNWNINNLSIILNSHSNLSLNVTFSDDNLFQASINISCDINGTIYYWEDLDIVSATDSITHTNTSIDLTNLPLQKCNIFLEVSDDHTDEKIPNYIIKQTLNGLEFNTDIDNIKIETNNFKSVKTKKMKDRYTFDFDFNNNELIKEFTVKSENKLYPRYGDYRGHLVSWDGKQGNWIDFETDLDLNLKYTMTKINDYEYNVRIESVIPKDVILEPRRDGFLGLFGDYMTDDELKKYYYGFDKLQFKSLGGTNIFNVSYDFYIGGTLNVSAFNIINTSPIYNWTVTVTTLDSYPGLNQTETINGTTALLYNFTNGTYELEFYHPQHFNQTYIVNMTGILQYLNYTSYQSILNIIIKNILTLETLTNNNITLNKTGFLQENYNNGTFYLNASDYDILVEHSSFANYSDNYTTSYRTNHTYIIYISALANFILLDEFTLETFNVSGTDSIKFLLLCPDETQQTSITSANQTIEIGCKYEKFKFILDYGTTSYYRTFIVEYDEIFNQTIYLIDLLTTQSIYNSFILDDLLGLYENPALFVKKTIGGNNVLITSDYADIENKVGAYLIENHEYSVEVHSDNQAVLILGDYSADIAGEKAIALYDVSIYPETSNNFENDVWWTMGTYNQSNTTYARFRYYDRANLTTEVTFYIWKDNYNGTLINNYTISGSYDITYLYNISGYSADTLYAGIEITHPELSTHWTAKILQINAEIILGIQTYVGENFLNWFFTLFLGGLALMATISTGNQVSMAMIGLASLFILFGWFTLSWSALGLAGLVSLVSILREGSNPK